jgi:hypothetical protein
MQPQLRLHEGRDEIIAVIIAGMDVQGERNPGRRASGTQAFRLELLFQKRIVAVCGWLMERQGRIAAGRDEAFYRMKAAAARFYLEQIVPEALGLEAAARAPAERLYLVDAETFAA